MDWGQSDTLERLVLTRQSRRTVLGAILGAALLFQGSDDQEFALITLINDYRVANGLSPLTQQPQLMAAAEVQALDQATRNTGRPTHQGSDGSDALQRILNAGYANWRSYGENVAYQSSDGSAYATFIGWQNSPPHNAQMLATDVTDIGVGRAQSSTGAWYWTAVFASHW